MKSKFTIMFFLLMITSSALAQKPSRIGYIDMEYILQNMEEYQLALQQLNGKKEIWKLELEEKEEKLNTLIKNLNYERILLSRQLIKDREEEIEHFQKELYRYQQKRFGPGGDYEIQQLKLVQPIQDKVFEATHKIAKAKRLDMVFDRSRVAMIYTNKAFDISNLVFKLIRRQSRKEEKEKKEEEGHELESVKKNRAQEEKELNSQQKNKSLDNN